jgi:dTDP-4-amino-4,6-dideoxygalactose transaminase
MATNLGRTALTTGLKALGLERDAGVILPTVICPTVIRAVLKADCRPILVDVEEDLHLSVRTLTSCHLEHARAVVAPHLYGLYAPIKEIAEWSKSNGLYLVDDAAQAVGISVDGKYLGNFGDFGILSFGPFKSLSAPRGGALISDNEKITAKAKENDLPQERFHEAVLRIVSGLIKFHFRPHFLKIDNKFNLRKSMVKSSSKSSNYHQLPDETFQLSNLEARLAQSVLGKVTSIIVRRRKTAYETWKVLKEFDKFEFVGSNNSPYVKIPIRLHGALRAEEAVSFFRSMQIEAERIYRPLHLNKDYEAYASQPLPIAEENWERVFLIPNPVTGCRFGQNRLAEAFTALSKF